MEILLSCREHAKSYGLHALFRGITLGLFEGQRTGLIGPNGSGKSTLFGSIVGAHAVDGGSIAFAGEEITRLRTPQIARRGLIRTYQQTRIYRKMSCLENMLISTPAAGERWLDMLKPRSIDDTDEAEELLEFVGLYAKRHLLAGSLSFGQQKLLEFAMALMNRPRMLLLDEPTAGINPTLINGLLERLKRVNADLGITLFVIEHNMRVIMNLAEHIYCLAHGELLAAGTPDQVRNDKRVIDAYLGVH